MDCLPTGLVRVNNPIEAGECPVPENCVTARSFLCVREPDLAAVLGEYPCGKEAEVLYIRGAVGFTEEGMRAYEEAQSAMAIKTEENK